MPPQTMPTCPLARDDTRRHIMDLVRDADLPLAVEDLAADVAAWNADAENEPTDDDRMRARVRLLHVHLPALDDAEYLSYDREANEVTDWNQSETNQ